LYEQVTDDDKQKKRLAYFLPAEKNVGFGYNVVEAYFDWSELDRDVCSPSILHQ